MTQARSRRTLGASGAERPKGPQPKSKPEAILRLSMDDSQFQVVVDAARAEGESVSEYIYGAAAMRLSQELRLMERFLAGFSLSAPEVARLNQMGEVRKAATSLRQDLTGLLTEFLDTKHKLHRKHEQEQLDQVFRPDSNRP
jgi:hypothetical protein